MLLRMSVIVTIVIASVLANENEVVQKWLQANKMFKNAQSKEQYLEVVSMYEEIIDKGVKNGYVYYNLANTYLKAQRLDYAILNYKRAERYIPTDPYLIEHLKLATAQLQEKIEFKKVEEQIALRYLFFWHFNWKYDMRLLVFIIVYTCFWLLLIAKLLSWKIPFWNLFVPTTVVLLAIGGSVAHDVFFEVENSTAVLVGNNIEIRKGDAATYEELYGEQKIPGGVEVKVLEQRNDWSKIELPDRLHGWVKSNFIKKIYD
ncbi:hypothetical protein [Candidatus Uabimicrobium sp. HlEnr_7]|uniref:tetratricopeptide repeat protein n=1 Tax=Candidatus Uabimicrobium helgolandensis TaxID=3095367 RepID=UPI003556760A